MCPQQRVRNNPPVEPSHNLPKPIPEPPKRLQQFLALHVLDFETQHLLDTNTCQQLQDIILVAWCI